MSFRLRPIAIIALLSVCVGASAGPVLWQFSNVTFGDGGTASGSFIFDPDAGTACSGGTSPCGMYSSVDIVTTAGSTLLGMTYNFVCGQDVPSCSGLKPDSTEAIFLASNASDQTGGAALALFFTGVGGFPPAGLTDLGGVIDISNSSLSVGAAIEEACANGVCSAPSGPSRSSVSGDVVTPEPGTSVLSIAALGAIILRVRRTSGKSKKPH